MIQVESARRTPAATMIPAISGPCSSRIKMNIPTPDRPDITRVVIEDLMRTSAN